MALTAIVALATSAAADVNQYKDHLEGESSSTLAWFLRCSTSNDFIIRLSDAAGARKFSLQDSAGVEVASIDSDGTVAAIDTSFTALTVPTAASPAQTAVGSLVYDTALLLLTVGNGSGRDAVGSGDPVTIWGLS